jgi:hypothetical protein
VQLNTKVCVNKVVCSSVRSSRTVLQLPQRAASQHRTAGDHGGRWQAKYKDKEESASLVRACSPTKLPASSEMKDVHSVRETSTSKSLPYFLA